MQIPSRHIPWLRSSSSPRTLWLPFDESTSHPSGSCWQTPAPEASASEFELSPPGPFGYSLIV